MKSPKCEARTRKKGEELLDALVRLATSTYAVLLDDPNQLPKFKALIEEASGMADRLDNKRAKISLTTLNTRRGDFERIEPEVEKGWVRTIVELGRELGDEKVQRYYSRVLLDLQGRHSEAATLEQPIIDDFLASGDISGLKEFYFFLMWFHLRHGNFGRCIECCDTGTELAAQIGSAPVQYATLKALALLSLGRFGDAWSALQQEVADEKHPFGRAFHQLGTGVYFYSLMDDERAGRIFADMLESDGFVGRAWMRDISLAYSALIDARRPSALVPADHTAVARGSIFLAPYDAGEVLVAQGRHLEALAYAEEICDATQVAGPHGRYPHALLLKAQALRALGRQKDVEPVIRLAISIGRKMGYSMILWRLHALYAEALDRQGATDMAITERSEAARILSQLAKSIPDATSQDLFLSHPQVTAILGSESG